MMLALDVALAATIFLLALATFAQVLYLESLRLRTRDLPSLKFFKETLEDKIGLDAEQGAGSFSLVKHTLVILLALGYYAELEVVWEAALAAWITMVATAFALPQLLYRRTTARWMMPLVPLVRALAWIARPVEAVLTFFQRLIDLADDEASAEEPPTPAENIEALISAGTEEGLIGEQDRELIQSVVEFGDKVVREVMTPRPNIVAIQADATLEQLRQIVITEQYSRIPAYEQNVDHIVGFVHVRDMFEIDEEEREDRLVRELVRTILFVPETKPVNELMRQMQQEGAHMVIVVDEYGGTAGLATMEDLLEVIIGEIRDEHEPSSDVVEDGRGGFIVSGNFDLARVGDLLESFHPEENIESTTVGGLISEWLGRVPRPGEFVERDGVRSEVLASDNMRVAQVRLSRPAGAATARER